MLGEDDGKIQLNNFIANPSSKPLGYDLTRSQWVLLNRLWSGHHGQYASFMHRIGFRKKANCICGAIQTPHHVLNCRMIEIRGDLRTVYEDFRNWIGNNKLLEL